VQLGKNRPCSRFRRMRLGAGSGRREPTGRQCAQASDCDQVATATMHHSAPPRLKHELCRQGRPYGQARRQDKPRQPDRPTSPAAAPSESGVEDRSASRPTNPSPAVEDQPNRLNRRADSENPRGGARHATGNAGSKGIGPRPQNDHEAATGVRSRGRSRTTSRVRHHADPRRRSESTPTNIRCRFNRTGGQLQDHARNTGPLSLRSR
jgi:hypothetical protein